MPYRFAVATTMDLGEGLVLEDLVMMTGSSDGQRTSSALDMGGLLEETFGEAS